MERGIDIGGQTPPEQNKPEAKPTAESIDAETEQDLQRIEAQWQKSIDKTATTVAVERANKAADKSAEANAAAAKVLSDPTPQPASEVATMPVAEKQAASPLPANEKTSNAAIKEAALGSPAADQKTESSTPQTPKAPELTQPATENRIAHYKQTGERFEKRLAAATTEADKRYYQKLVDDNQRVLQELSGPSTEPVAPMQPTAPEAPVATQPPETTTPTVIESKPVTEITPATEPTNNQAPQERFNSLQQDLITTLAEQGVSVALYRRGNEIRADYADKNGKTIGLETLRTLFGDEMPKVAETVGNLEALAYTNPELFGVRETATAEVSRHGSESVDRLGKYMVSNANKLKPKGLWSQAKQWFSRGRAGVASIVNSFQAKVGEIQRQRSEQRVASNFQRFTKNFNLMTPDMIRADKAMVGLTREIDSKSQDYIDAADIVSMLKEKVRRLKVMEARVERTRKIRDLEKQQDKYQRQMNMLNGQLAKLKGNYNGVKQQLSEQQTLEKQSLEEQLRAKTPERPTEYSQEQEMDEVLARTAKVGPEISEPRYENAPDDRQAKLGTQPTEFDQTQADESVASTNTSQPVRTIPLGPAVATPNNTPPSTPAPEAQLGEAA